LVKKEVCMRKALGLFLVSLSIFGAVWAQRTIELDRISNVRATMVFNQQIGDGRGGSAYCPIIVQLNGQAVGDNVNMNIPIRPIVYGELREEPYTEKEIAKFLKKTFGKKLAKAYRELYATGIGQVIEVVE